MLTDSLAGRDSFQLYCAPCHGTDTRGNGPVAPALKTAPPDLTQLARRNGGAFPADRVRAFVTGIGRTLPTHGPAEMPVWGPTFRAFETDVRVQERIKNLVATWRRSSWRRRGLAPTAPSCSRRTARRATAQPGRVTARWAIGSGSHRRN